MHCLFLTVGLPGSGKSTYAKQFISNHHEKIVYLSSDELRAKFGKDENDQSVTPKVFSYIKQQVDILLESKQNVLVDATNVNRKERKDYIDCAIKYGAKVIVFVFELEREQLIERNVKRGATGGRNVPEHVIDKMLLKYEKPSKEEGIDEIVYV